MQTAAPPCAYTAPPGQPPSPGVEARVRVPVREADSGRGQGAPVPHGPSSGAVVTVLAVPGALIWSNASLGRTSRGDAVRCDRRGTGTHITSPLRRLPGSEPRGRRRTPA